MQLAPQGSSSPFGHNSYVPNMKYAYDVAARSGRVTASIRVDKIDTATPQRRVGQSLVCPVANGACVSSVTGGVVEGYDMYGQFIKETVGAAGTGKIAFASISKAPADVKWTLQFGLPYKWLSGSMSGYTITAPAADGDARGTIVRTAAVTGPAIIPLDYIADQSSLMGSPYATRIASAAVDSVSIAVTATISAAGVCALTTGASTPAGQKFTATFPDGHTERGTCGTVLNYTLSPVWVKQYKGVINAAAANKLIAVGFDNTAIKPIYATVTGGIISLSEGEPEGLMAMSEPEPEAVTDTLPTFNSHAQIDDYVALHQIAVPDDWTTLTLAAKRAFLAGQ